MLLSSKSRLIGGLAVITVCVAVVLLVVLHTDDRTDAAPLPRGSAVTVPDRPPALDAGAVLGRLNSARKEAALPALKPSSCLDGLAAAAALQDPSAPASMASRASGAGCGAGVRSGWVSGTDPSGVQMVAAALTRQPAGPSPLLDRSAHTVGLALVPQRAGAGLIGYALCWAVAP